MNKTEEMRRNMTAAGVYREADIEKICNLQSGSPVSQRMRGNRGRMRSRRLSVLWQQLRFAMFRRKTLL